MGRGRAPTRPAGGGVAREHWEHLDHGADIGVRGIGATKAAAFEQAALALTAVIADPRAIEPRQTVSVGCAGDDDGQLLVAWLDAVIGQMARRDMLFSRFHVEFRPGGLVGSATGERVAAGRHHPAVTIKGATTTDLRVARTDDGVWLAQTIVAV